MLVFALCSACAGCDSAPEVGGDGATPAAESPPNADDPSPAFDFATADACALLSVAQVAGVYGVTPSAVTASPAMKAKPHRKVCRYSWKVGDGEAVLTLDAQARRDGRAADRFTATLDAAKTAGLPISGRSGALQSFTGFGGLGDEAYYSGNVNDSKALLARFGDAYVLSLQHHQFETDTGDQKANLVALGRAAAKRLTS